MEVVVEVVDVEVVVLEVVEVVDVKVVVLEVVVEVVDVEVVVLEVVVEVVDVEVVVLEVVEVVDVVLVVLEVVVEVVDVVEVVVLEVVVEVVDVVVLTDESKKASPDLSEDIFPLFIAEKNSDGSEFLLNSANPLVIMPSCSALMITFPPVSLPVISIV